MLDVIGDRWTILILRDLVRFGPRKFQGLQHSLSGISPNTLSLRLKRLEEAGVVERRFYEQHPPRAEYPLTKKGDALRQCCTRFSNGISVIYGISSDLPDRQELSSRSPASGNFYS